MLMKMYNKKDKLLTLLFLIAVVAIVTTTAIATTTNQLKENSNLFNHDGHSQEIPRSRVRRQYYVCPPDFERISSNCYYFSRHMATWQNALHDCIDRHSELAILQNPAEDKKLRGQLNKSPKPLEWWIGGIYDWEQMKWKWGGSGKQLTYHGFSRMGPENKDKLKWHCTILDPTMKYKWSARSCVLGKHYICQKKVMRVGKRGLDKLRKKYNNTLNEVPAPLIYEKPRKPLNKQQQLLKQQAQAQAQTQHNYRALMNNNAYGHQRNNNTDIRKGKKRNQNQNRNRNRNRNEQRKHRKNKHNNENNRKNKNYGLHIRNRNGTDFGDFSMEHGYNDYRKNKKRNRRYKSKESKESKENNSLDLEDEFQRKKQTWNKVNKENNSMEELTQKTTFMTNTLSPLHPQVIVEEHDFLELNNN